MRTMKKYFKKDLCAGIAYLIWVPLSCWVSVEFALSMQPVIDSVLNMDTTIFQRAAILCAFWGILDICLLLLVEFINLKLLKNINISLKEDLCRAVLGMSYQDYTNKSNDYLSILNNDTETISTCYFSSLLTLYRVVWSFFLSVITVIGLSPVITVVVLFVGVASVLVPRLLGKKIDKLQLSLSSQKESYSKIVKDMLDGFSTIKTTQSERFFETNHHLSNEKTENLEYTINRNMYFATWFSMLCSSAAYILTLILGGILVLSGHITAGLVISISQLIGGIVAPLEEVPELLTQIRSVKSVCEKCETILCNRSPLALQKAEGEKLLCNDVMFHYNGTQNGIEKFSYAFEMGRKYLLAGVSGSGKSTLGQLIAGLYQCNKGSIQYPCSVTGQKDLLYVTQHSHVFCDTLRNNITLGEEYSDDEVCQALERCHLKDFLSKLPHGLDESLQENHSCSGGEAARINLARAILRKPHILISDEITANLDAHTAEQIDKLLLSLNDVLLLTITHKLSQELAENYDCILYIKDGHLAEYGTANELAESRGEFYHLLHGTRQEPERG